MLSQPLPRLSEARRALAAAKATLDDRMVLLLHFGRRQQWKLVMEHLDAAELAAKGKPGMRWVRDAILHVGRRREEWKERIMKETAAMAKPGAAPDSEELFLADYVRGQAQGILQHNEMLALLDVLRPLYARQPKHLEAMKRWRHERADNLNYVGRSAESARRPSPTGRRLPARLWPSAAICPCTCGNG